MNPTQEQIEAALRYAAYSPMLPSEMTLGDLDTLLMCDNEEKGLTMVCATILAAAYRAAIAENEELKAAILKLNQP
jgi:hypothetical protein